MRRILFVILAASCLALTPTERKLALHAKTELGQVEKERDAAKSELVQAQQTISDPQTSASAANQKAITAESQAKAEHDQLVKAVSQNAAMKKIVDQDKKWFGLGRIFYGLVDLAKHLLILVVILVVVGVLLTIFVPAARPILSMIGSFFSMIWARIMALFTPKPKV